MKTTANYLYRPLMVRAIQLPPADEDPTEDWKASLHELLDGIEWESGRNGQLAVFLPSVDVPIVARPGDWIVRDGDLATAVSPDVFMRTFMSARMSSEHMKLEMERVLHITTP